MRKCEWHCVDLRCDKIASVVDIKHVAFCQDHADCGYSVLDGDADVYRIPLDAEILRHLLYQEIERDYGRGQTAILDGLDAALARVAERWNAGEL